MIFKNPMERAKYYKHLSIIADNPNTAKFYEDLSEKYTKISKKGKAPWRF
jgi:hypothetical protein